MKPTTIYEKPVRPLRIKQKDLDNIFEAYKQTIVLSNVAGLVYRDRHTIANWIKQGEIDFRAQEDSLCARLFIGVKKAIADRLVHLEQMVYEKKQGWQRFAWLLERTARKDYSQWGDVIKQLEDKIEQLTAMIQERAKDPDQVVSAADKQWVKVKIMEKQHAKALDQGCNQETGSPQEGTGSQTGGEDPSSKTE